MRTEHNTGQWERKWRNTVNFRKRQAARKDRRDRKVGRTGHTDRTDGLAGKEGRGRTGQQQGWQRGQAAERSGTGSGTDRKDRHGG